MYELLMKEKVSVLRNVTNITQIYRGENLNLVCK
ncbi:hypothetical protein EC917_110158 [Bacillus thuringiensis]|uniref:Uncharacterized protein n=1 Tax=Bacillus thuringiensis TaxID=1428 RepID=A0A4R4BD10_BACTU|nr:hypothetical protein EC917_110158 [Bacillus thuringiensis]TCW53797.1 hypothetical protein EC910_11030 [Bacillus thuringiensis]